MKLLIFFGFGEIVNVVAVFQGGDHFVASFIFHSFSAPLSLTIGSFESILGSIEISGHFISNQFNNSKFIFNQQYSLLIIFFI